MNDGKLHLYHLTTPAGSLDRRQYLWWGGILMTIKVLLDQIVARVAFSREWGLWSYFEPVSTYPLSDLPKDERDFLVVIALMGLPFLAAGVCLTLQRLRNAQLSLWLVALFVVPFLNMFFFLLLCLIPSKEDNAGKATPPESAKPISPGQRAVMAIGTGLVTGVLLVLLMANVMEQYGLTLFLGTPFVIALVTGLVFHRGKSTASLGDCIKIALATHFLIGLALLLFAIEGLICILMAAPIGVIPMLLGSWMAHSILTARGQQRLSEMTKTRLTVSPLLLVGLLAFIEKNAPRGDILMRVESRLQVNASAEEIWPNMIAFSELPEPTELMFKLGIAYPTHARIEGEGVGAVRHCVFSTGAFVEPITAWEPNRRIAFDVIEQPHPMDEISIYHDVDTPHLHDFLRSKRGELRIEPQPNGTCILVGTTWYEHDIWPTPYWRIWSDQIIHKIHDRVLSHIANLSEKS